MSEWLRRFFVEEQGQDLIEYSLLITFIAIAGLWLVGASHDSISGIWTTANSHIVVANTVAGGGD